MYLQTVKYGILTMTKTAGVVFVSFFDAASLAHSSLFYCGNKMPEEMKGDLSVTTEYNWGCIKAEIRHLSENAAEPPDCN